MVMLIKPKSKEAASIVPNGNYKAVLSKVTRFDNAYGTRLGFEFTLQGEDVDGAKVMRSTTPNLSHTSKLADVLRGLLGRDLAPTELENGIDVEKLVGTECGVMVLQSKSKNGNTYSNVERVFPLTDSLI